MTEAGHRLEGAPLPSTVKTDERPAHTLGPQSPEGQRFRTALLSASPLKPARTPDSRDAGAT